MYDGRWVNVYPGFMIEGNLTCTPANPCDAANACAADELLGDTANAMMTVALLDPSTLAPITCSGTECDYQDMCPYAFGMQWVVTGPFRAQGLAIEAAHVNEGL